MKLRLVHAVASGVVLALALGFLLVPSLTLMASTQLGGDGAGTFTRTADNTTAESNAKGNAAAGVFGETTRPQAVLGLSPTTALALSALAVGLVLLSFLLIRRVGEPALKTS